MNKKYSKKEEEFSGISDMLEGRHHVIPIMSNDDEEAAEKVDIPQILPILTLRSSVLSRARSRRLRSGARSR